MDRGDHGCPPIYQRAGVVDHPEEWKFSGYNEILNPKRKNVLIAYDRLAVLCGYDSFKSFQFMYRALMEQTLSGGRVKREERWSRSLAVGEEEFVSSIKDRLSFRANEHQVESSGDDFQLRETVQPYNAFFNGKNVDICLKNTYGWM